MRAVYYDRNGGADVLTYTERFAVPKRKSGELLVRVLASSVNPVDWKIRLNKIPFFPSPKVTGCDVVGIVEDVDAKSRKFKPGDRVFAMLPNLDKQGGCCDYVTVKEHHAAVCPANLSNEQCAALPLVGQTVLQSFAKAGIVDDRSVLGKKILIHAGAGGVGSLAIQIAKAFGLYIYTTCSDRNIEFCKSLGADRVINYKTEKFEDVAKDLDFVFDVMGGDYELRSLPLLKSTGHYINIMNSGWATKIGSDKNVPDGISAVNSTLGSVSGFLYSGYRMLMQYVTGPYYHFCVVAPKQATMETISDLAQRGTIKPIIDKVFTLENTKDAHLYMEQGHARGKVIIKIDAQPKSKL